jgi:sporulation protein YlmC with PRC-barrel domain
MKRTAFACSLSACLGLAAPAFGADATATLATNGPTTDDRGIIEGRAQTCISDLRNFDRQMSQDGFWMGGSGYGLGYPVVGYGYSGAMSGSNGTIFTAPLTPPKGDTSSASGSGTAARQAAPAAANRAAVASPQANDYWRGRSGYEVRTLMASASILAQRGFQDSCENVLSATRDLYKRYLVEMRVSGAPMNASDWRQQQISAARPVTSVTAPFRSDQLIGAEVRNSQGQALGAVDDLVMNPSTGKIAYLVISRGGIFGFDEKYVPVPWADFKVTPEMNLLVLDSTEAVMATAPEVAHDQFSKPSGFVQVSENVNAYWKAHP